MKGRIRNQYVDVEIESDDEDDILEQFYRDYPHLRGESVTVRWERDG